MRARTILIVAACLSLFVLAGGSAVRSAEPEIKYPAKLTDLNGRIYNFGDVGHSLARGSFVLYDGETEGRVPWRDIDSITFVENIGHVPGSKGPKPRGTRRVMLKYVDGQERYVNLVVGRLYGFDGMGQRHVDADELAYLDFDNVRIAPILYKTCAHGHVWEEPNFRFCPYDGQELATTRLDGGP